MSQTKYKLREDLKMMAISLVRGYKDRVYSYHLRCEDIINKSGAAQDGQPKGNSISDPTCDKSVKIALLEQLEDVKAMRAVEQAKVCIATDMCGEIRAKFIDAIWDSCIEGRNFTFKYYNLPIGKTQFYERRREFLYNVLKNMGYI